MKKLIALLLTALLLLFLSAFAEGNRSISIEAEDTLVYISKKLALSATIKNLTGDAPSKTTLVWSTSDKSIARVDIKGTVTGVAIGTVTISCKAKDDESVNASVQLEVRASVKSLRLADKSITILLGAGKENAQVMLDYTILPEDAYDKSISWSSSDESVATVDANGVAQAVGSGKAIISAQSNDPNMTKASTCTVVVGHAVNSIKLSKNAATIEKGKTLKLSASVSPENALKTNTVWTSSNDSIVKVDTRGTLMAKKTGTATVTCTAADGSGINSICKITVVQNVLTITSKTKQLVLFEDETSKVSVSVLPLDATNKAVKWSSSDPYVASVDNSGTIVAKNAGETTITATTVDGGGKKATLKVIVEPAIPITVDSIGSGRYLPNLFGLTVENKCKTKTIKEFRFDMEIESYNGSTIDGVSYSLRTAATIGARQTKTIKSTVFGVDYATKVVITITGVTFSDGSYYSIPSSLQETSTYESLTERLLSDEKIIALTSDTTANMQKLVSRPADAIALLNACIGEERFANIIDGSQASAPGSNVYTCQSGKMCLNFANYVDPKDFNFMVAYLLADDFDAGVLMGLPAGGPNSAICYIKSGGAFQLFDASAVIKHGRYSSFPFTDARVEQLQDYVDNVKQKLKYRILFSLPSGAGVTYTDFGTYVSIDSTDATVYWSAENELK